MDNRDRNQGLYPKYLVFKHPKLDIASISAEAVVLDGEVGGKVPLDLVNDFTFILKPIKDKHARVALAAYAESCKEEYPHLSQDIYEVLSDF